MKKLIFAFALMFGAMFVSCGNSTNSANAGNDSICIDTVQVDTLNADTASVDTVYGLIPTWQSLSKES